MIIQNVDISGSYISRINICCCCYCRTRVWQCCKNVAVAAVETGYLQGIQYVQLYLIQHHVEVTLLHNPSVLMDILALM